MAEFEFAGTTFRGGKMFIVLTALSTLGGGAWGAFEFYNDYRNMKEMIESYVAPDMSGIDQELAVQREMMDSIIATVDGLVVDVDKMEDRVNSKVDKIETLTRKVDETTAETQRELRDDVYSIEKEVNDRLRTVDEDIRNVRKDLEEKIEIILNNPLNN
jgi:BMFP domain-containing protein YqiC